MIILDTTVFSALLRLDREPLVKAWLAEQSVGNLYVPTPAIFEMRYGIEHMPNGRKRKALAAGLDAILAGTFAGRIVALDEASANAAGSAHHRHVASGRNVETPDSLIAGIAVHLRAAVATRNVSDFTGLGLKLIDPWHS